MHSGRRVRAGGATRLGVTAVTEAGQNALLARAEVAQNFGTLRVGSSERESVSVSRSSAVRAGGPEGQRKCPSQRLSLSCYFLCSHAVSLHCSLSPFAQAFSPCVLSSTSSAACILREPTQRKCPSPSQATSSSHMPCPSIARSLLSLRRFSPAEDGPACVPERAQVRPLPQRRRDDRRRMFVVEAAQHAVPPINCTQK